MRRFLIATAAVALLAGAPNLAHACSDSETTAAVQQLNAYLQQNPNKQQEAQQKWQQIVSGYGGRVPEGQRCNALRQLLAQLQSDR